MSQGVPWRSLAVILGVSTLLKLALLWPATRLPLRGDERQYAAGAAAIAETGVPTYPNPVWDEAHSSPLYPYALAALERLLGDEGLLSAARGIQVVLSSLTVLFVYIVAVRAFDARNALLSAGIAAFSPTLVAYSHYLYTETAYIFFFVGLAAVLLGGRCTPGRALAAGLVGGLAALTRGAFVIQAPFVVLWLLVAGGASRSRRALAAGMFLLGMALVIGPWSVRNSVRYDRFLLIDTNGGNVLHKNWNAIRQENHDIGMSNRWLEDKLAYRGTVPFRERIEENHLVDRDRAETRAAVRFVLAHPLLYARNTVIRAAEFVNPTSFLVRAIRWGDYGELPGPLAATLVGFVLLGTMGLLTCGVLGLAARPPAGSALLPALMILGNVAVSVLIVSMSRYRLPLMPLLIPFAVDGAQRCRQLAAERTARLWVACAVILLMAVAWWFYVPYSL